jgi:hypothetical protein
MCECRTTCQHCGRPRADCLAADDCFFGRGEIPSGYVTDDGHVIFEPYRRWDALEPGQTIEVGEEPWCIDVVGVSGPDKDGMVTVWGLQGALTYAADWPVCPLTPQDVDLRATLLIEEQHATRPGIR